MLQAAGDLFARVKRDINQEQPRSVEFDLRVRRRSVCERSQVGEQFSTFVSRNGGRGTARVEDLYFLQRSGGRHGVGQRQFVYNVVSAIGTGERLSIRR